MLSVYMRESKLSNLNLLLILAGRYILSVVSLAVSSLFYRMMRLLPSRPGVIMAFFLLFCLLPRCYFCFSRTYSDCCCVDVVSLYNISNINLLFCCYISVQYF